MMASGAAILAAADKVEAQARDAAQLLEAAAADIGFEGGRFTVAGTDRGIGILELAQARARRPAGRPPDRARCACSRRHAALDLSQRLPHRRGRDRPGDGHHRVQRYTAVDDFGTVVNPMLVEGQVHGGVAQGIGQALLESTVYGDDGQLLTGSFMDYAMPRADDVSALDVGFNAVPATTNPLGVKGCGEAGCSGALPAVMNAVVDALAPLGIDHLDMPATPERVWRAIQGARPARAAAA